MLMDADGMDRWMDHALMDDGCYSLIERDRFDDDDDVRVYSICVLAS